MNSKEKDQAIDMFGEKVYEQGPKKIYLDIEGKHGGFWKVYNNTFRIGTFTERLDHKVGK